MKFDNRNDSPLINSILLIFAIALALIAESVIEIILKFFGV